MTTTCCNPYVFSPTSSILDIISGVQNLKLPLFQSFFTVDNSDVYSAILPIDLPFTDAKYLSIQARPMETPNFFSINEHNQGVLLAEYKQINAIGAKLISYRSALYLVYKNIHYQLRFPVANIDQLVKIKSVLMNTFSMTGHTVVLWDHLVIHFTRFSSSETPSVMDPYFRISYMGYIDYEVKDSECISLTSYDYGGGTLVGLVDRMPFFFINEYAMGTLNRYPYTNYEPLNQLILGGYNTYALTPNGQNPYHLYQVDVATELQYQFDELLTNYNWGYVPLQRIIVVKGSECSSPIFGPFYILGFISEKFPPITFTGTTQFLNSDNTLLTQPIETVYSADFKGISWRQYPESEVPDEEPIAGTLYYTWLIEGEKMTLLYFQGTFTSFLVKFKGTTSIQDLLYSSEINETKILATNVFEDGEDMTQGYTSRHLGATAKGTNIDIREGTGVIRGRGGKWKGIRRKDFQPNAHRHHRIAGPPPSKENGRIKIMGYVARPTDRAGLREDSHPDDYRS